MTFHPDEGTTFLALLYQIGSGTGYRYSAIDESGERMGAREQLAQMHYGRFYTVQDQIAPGERLLDTGSARAEQVPGWRSPSGNEDFGGYLVVTDLQVIYKDRYGVLAMPWDEIRGMGKYRVKGLMTTGLEVTLADGRTLLFSGNTPFIKALIRMSR